MTPRSPSPKQQLSAAGLRAKHHFGQNFLADEALCHRIALLAAPEAGITVIEIGAGLGALTAPLVERASRVIAIERDRELLPVLTERFADALAEQRLVLVEADAKQVDFFERAAPGARIAIAGNLPYQITGPLLERLCGVASRIERAVIMVQLEVAQRLVAAPASGAYGALSVFVQAQFSPVREIVVRRGAFFPQPRVDSAVISLTPRTPPLADETPAFRELVQRAFQQRRKQLKNAWRGISGADGTDIEQAAHAAGIDLGQRGECLGVAEFRRMAEELERG